MTAGDASIGTALDRSDTADAADAASSSSLSVVVGPQVSSAVRHHVRTVLAAHGADDGVQLDAELLVGELVSNVIRHEHSATVRVDVAARPDGTVTVTVTGESSPPAPALAHPADRPPATSDRGRGLGVLDSLSLAWGTRREHGTTSVWFTVGDRVVESAPLVPVRTPAAPTSSMAAVAGVASSMRLVTASDGAAGRAALSDRQAAADAAVLTADVARRARAARAVAATLAADAVAATAARTVEAVQAAADELAVAVATAAADDAAETLSSSVVAGAGRESVTEGHRLGATVLAAAVQAEETARGAVLVARAVARAATAVAEATGAEVGEVNDEILLAARAVRAVTAATSQQLAAETLQHATVVEAATQRAAAASEQLRRANLELQQAGRRDRSVALALQQATLTQLPETVDLSLAARYLSAAQDDEVGGDWYDALLMRNGWTALVIGDVVGHDIAAATAMGQLRNMLRALAWDRAEPPSTTVSRLDRAIRDLNIDTTATLVLVMIEPGSSNGSDRGDRALYWTNAGHPAPVLVHADGTAVVLREAADLLLGVDAESDRYDMSHSVPSGATLLMYTDGLVESPTQDIEVGIQRLLEVAQAHHREEPDAFLDAVLGDMVGGRPGDDVAVLAARFS